MSKRTPRTRNKFKVLPIATKHTYEMPLRSARELDSALYALLQLAYDLKLISKEAFHHATTCETKLFDRE